MGYYSDPTASMAVGHVSKEFSKYEKKAKSLRKLYRMNGFEPDMP